MKKILLSLGLLFLLGTAFAGAAYNAGGVKPADFWRDNLEKTLSEKITETDHSDEISLPAVAENKPLPVEVKEEKKVAAEVKPVEKKAPTPEVKQEIKKDPPKQETTSSTITGEKIENGDGSRTVIVSEGTASQAELSRIAAAPENRTGSPYGIKFTDETGKNAGLEIILKDYLNSTLRWGTEIGSLREIVVRDAGETGWNGQYSGSYTVLENGDITSAYGGIVLNTRYYGASPLFNDYMKLVFSHEYGHHYTLYHKWVDADLPAGSRFPDSYYAARPLAKESTTVDCGTGWLECEPEIIAEDYSYLFSGYGYHAMQAEFGLPSEGTRDWLANISESLKSIVPAVAASPPPPQNKAPVVTITSPADNAEISSRFVFSVNASDDKGVSKVVFYRNSDILVEDAEAPYEAEINLSALGAGDYVFKAKAFDGDGASVEQSFTLSITRIVRNSESPPAAPPVEVPAAPPAPIAPDPASPNESDPSL